MPPEDVEHRVLESGAGQGRLIAQEGLQLLGFFLLVVVLIVQDVQAQLVRFFGHHGEGLVAVGRPFAMEEEKGGVFQEEFL